MQYHLSYIRKLCRVLKKVTDFSCAKRNFERTPLKNHFAVVGATLYCLLKNTRRMCYIRGKYVISARKRTKEVWNLFLCSIKSTYSRVGVWLRAPPTERCNCQVFYLIMFHQFIGQTTWIYPIKRFSLHKEIRVENVQGLLFSARGLEAPISRIACPPSATFNACVQ